MSADAPVAAEAPTPTRYRLLSKENEEFRMNEKAVRLSGTLLDLIENLDYTPEKIESSDPIPVANVPSAALEKVIEWCEHYENDPPAAPAANGARNRTIPEWDETFVKMDYGQLYDLVVAANYLNIQGLLDVTCKVVARMAEGKGPEELRRIYDIPTDAEDEAAERLAAEAARATI